VFKSNGREKPADKKEFAHLRRKLVYCPNCKDYHSEAANKFTGSTCEVCGAQLKYEGEPDGYKTTG
jgi:hypothetical protein